VNTVTSRSWLPPQYPFNTDSDALSREGIYSRRPVRCGAALEQVITKGKELDMTAVHKEIAEREAAAPERT